MQRAGVSLTPVGRCAAAPAGALRHADLRLAAGARRGQLAAAPRRPPTRRWTRSALDVRIGQLDLYGKRLNDVACARAPMPRAGPPPSLRRRSPATSPTARTAAAGWSRALRASSVPGSIRGRRSAAALEPNDLPTLDLVAERFSLRGKELGRVELQGSRAGEDWRIDKLAMANADASLAASGRWRGGAPTRSRARLRAERGRRRPVPRARRLSRPGQGRQGAVRRHRSPGTASSGAHRLPEPRAARCSSSRARRPVPRDRAGHRQADLAHEPAGAAAAHRARLPRRVLQGLPLRPHRRRRAASSHGVDGS